MRVGDVSAKVGPALKTLPLSILFLALAAVCAAAADELESFADCRLVPTDWADGDSFHVRFPDGKEHTLRLYGADCLEWHVNDEGDARRLRAQGRYFGIAGGDPRESSQRARAFGEAAAKRTRELLAEPFVVHTAFADGRGDARFQRIYAFVTTAGGEDLASALVREGLARAYGVFRKTPDGASSQEYRGQLQDLELTAATAKRGIWEKTDWSRLPEDRRTERREEQELSEALTAAPPNDGVDPNTASRDELMSLPGIGEVLSLRIIEGRSDGPYKSEEDLLRVKGISPKTLEGLQSSLHFPSP